MTLTIDTTGFRDIETFFRRADEAADRAIAPSVSEAARFGRALASREIRQQVNFSASYLNSQGRLEVQREDANEATIKGRNRPTSLARRPFSTTPITFGRRKRGVRVKVSRQGSGHLIDGAFFVRLRNGNVGLAVRPPDGRRPSRGAVPIFNGAFLLYGPSVGQVAFDVFPDIEPQVSDRLSDEFIRQFRRFSRG